MIVWVVALDNYEPAEILGIYDNEPAAQQHAEAANRGDGLTYAAVAWHVGSAFDPDHYA